VSLDRTRIGLGTELDGVGASSVRDNWKRVFDDWNEAVAGASHFRDDWKWVSFDWNAMRVGSGPDVFAAGKSRESWKGVDDDEPEAGGDAGRADVETGGMREMRR
jgi:hypothetical protein